MTVSSGSQADKKIFFIRFVADTQCTKHPRQFCAANGCKFEAGERECHNKTIQSAVDVPEESCDLVPQKTCQVSVVTNLAT